VCKQNNIPREKCFLWDGLIIYTHTHTHILAGCTMFPHLPAHIWHLHHLLPPVASVIPVFTLFSHQSSNPFCPVSLGLLHFLLLGGRHFITSFGNLPSSILWTCPYHWSCLVLISSKRPYYIHFLFNNSIPDFVLPGDEPSVAKSPFLWNLVLLPFLLINTTYVIVLLTTAW